VILIAFSPRRSKRLPSNAQEACHHCVGTCLAAASDECGL
jgi:hypothetical protein